MHGLAVALLTSSYQQLTGSDLQPASTAGSSHQASLLDIRKQVGAAMLSWLALMVGATHRPDMRWLDWPLQICGVLPGQSMHVLIHLAYTTP